MKGLHHVGITVKDLDASIRFYHDVLGLQFSNEPSPWFEGEELGPAVGVPGAALRQVSLLLGDTTLELLEYKSPPSETARPLGSNSLGASHVAFLRRRHPRHEGRARGEGHRVLQRRQRRRRGRARGVEVGLLRGSGRLPARARRGRVLQRRGAADRASRRTSRRDRRLPSARGRPALRAPTTRTTAKLRWSGRTGCRPSKRREILFVAARNHRPSPLVTRSSRVESSPRYPGTCASPGLWADPRSGRDGAPSAGYYAPGNRSSYGTP